MPSKSEYKLTFNELLGTDIDWEKLTKEELAQLMVIFAHPEILAEKLGLNVTISPTAPAHRKKFVEGLLTNFKETWESYEGPLITKIREVVDKNPKKV